MNTTISPLKFLLTNVICLTVGALGVLDLRMAGKAAYAAAGKRKANIGAMQA